MRPASDRDDLSDALTGFVPDILASLYGRRPGSLVSAVPFHSPNGGRVVLDHLAYLPPQGVCSRVILLRLEVGQATLDDRELGAIAEACRIGWPAVRQHFESIPDAPRCEFLMVVPSARWEAASLRVHRVFDGMRRALWQVASWPGVVHGFEPRRREHWERWQDGLP